MSDYHIRESAIKDNRTTVVLHIPVPDVVNVVGVNYRTALRQFEPAHVSVVEGVTQAEQDAINAGSIVERVVHVEYLGGASDASKLQAVEAAFTLHSSPTALLSQLAHLRAQLKYWGKSGDVA